MTQIPFQKFSTFIRPGFADTSKMSCDIELIDPTYKGTPAKLMSEMYNLRSKIFADINVVVGENKMPAHKAVLMVGSNYFKGVLEPSCDQVNIQMGKQIVTSTSAINNIIRYIYTGKICMVDICDTFKFAIFLDLTDLVKNLQNFLLINFEKIIKKDYFCHFNVLLLIDLIKSDKVQIKSEQSIFEAVRTWINFDRMNRRGHSLDLMKYVKLQHLSRRYVISEVEPFLRVSLENYGHVLFDLWRWYDMPEKRCDLTYITEKPRKIMNAILVGSDSASNSRIEMYDYGKKCWKELFCWSEKSLLTSYVCVMHNNNLLVLGGEENDGCPLNEVFSINLKTKEITSYSSMNEGRIEFTASNIGNSIIVCGGIRDDVLDSAEIYKPEKRRWYKTSPMRIPRFSHAATVYDGKVYIFGGMESHESGPIKSMEIYDPTINQWWSGPSMQMERAHFSAVTFEDYIYVIGGNRRISHTNTVERYDPRRQKWTYVKQLPSTLTRNSAVSINGRILCVAGSCKSGVYEFDPTRDVWTTLPTTNPKSEACLLEYYHEEDE